jgi:two-component system, NtrC family, response regulator GlrR
MISTNSASSGIANPNTGMNTSFSPGTKDWILVVDDDDQVTDILSLVLESEGYLVRTCSSGIRALDLVGRNQFSLVLLDLRLGEESGLDLLPRLRESVPGIPIFIITAHGDVDSAVDAFTLGANGYIKKPFREGDLKVQIAQAIENYKLRSEVQTLRALTESGDVRDLIRSRDPVMEPVLRRVAMAAQVGSSVVITGESGTGKELVAKALHRCGPRKKAPFIAFNCAALPETLLESELFGYVRGAFTDAKETKQGLFQRAHGGTLFLDEIGDAPLSIQTKLLRVLQEREVLPVGGSTPIPVDARVIAATHRSLQDEVAAGRFRQDLYYRLHVLPIQVPSLRERPKDIFYLASVFAAQLAEEMKIAFEGFSPSAVRALEEHPWPGNVRELQNRVEHALAVERGGKITARGLFPEKIELASVDESLEAAGASLAPGVAVGNAVESFKDAKNSFERSYLEKVLTAARGNIAKAARMAEKSRTEVYSLLKKHGLDPLRFKSGHETESE